MLSLLHIENIAVIQSADIRFEPGFNVLTGETGAGKSIVIDAIGAVMGERTSRDLIRTGAGGARVSAVFCALPALAWFAENGVAPDENGELLLERELLADGRNVCRVNGRPLTVAQLKLLGRQLLNIHGQHDGQQLLDPACHLDYLDSFGQTEGLLAKYAEQYHALTDIRRQLNGLRMDEAEKARRVDTLTYQIAELERADLTAGEDETLTARRDLLRNAGRIMDAVEAAYQALSGDSDRGAVELLAEAQQALNAGGRVSEELAKMGEKAAELRYAAYDLAEEIRDLRDGFESSAGELDQIEGRLDLIYRLKKKYGATVDDMLTFLDRSRQELEQIQYADDTIARLEGQLAKALEQAKAAAETLSAARKAAAVMLQTRIEDELSQLDMPKVRFMAEFTEKAGETGLDETGMDTVQFLMSANVGEELKPIHKIASGGELARIMLALKNVLAENEQVTTLIFDEVDTGVSGRAAQKVARKMSDVARSKQVLCVTHLPQIAAMADSHFCVEKGEADGRTFTAVQRLDEEQRCAELARLTSGDLLTPAALQGAGEMLAQARAYKQGG
ncbi:MAG: DNA repair protein RecN [Oscillospiraceae bacterium]|nr:DNA repair protein RecN [Oscillospiraceae bacterium]